MKAVCALPGSEREAAINGCVRSLTSTICKPEEPADTYAYLPLTATSLVAPGIVKVDRRVGVKFCTVPGTPTPRVLLRIVTIQLPGAPAKIRPRSAPKLQIVRSLEAKTVRGS